MRPRTVLLLQRGLRFEQVDESAFGVERDEGGALEAAEARAREVTEYRQRAERQKSLTVSGRGTLEQMFDQIKAGEAQELPVVIRGDVQGSIEAIVGSLEKLSTDEVKVRVMHNAVGGITESDVILAKSAGGLVIGFIEGKFCN